MSKKIPLDHQKRILNCIISRNNQELTMQEEKKNSWSHQSGYIWALIGSAVGFANILSFSAKAYFYGGGAFLIPFITAIAVLGVPLLCLEGVIGQYFNLPLVAAYEKVAGSFGKFFGWLAIITVTTIGGFYMLLTGWTVAYCYFTATDAIPNNSLAFLHDTFLQKSTGIADFGTFAAPMFICTMMIAFFAWYIVSHDIQSGIEKICSIFLPLLAILIAFLTILVMFLPGAWQGFAYYISPDFAVLANPRLWLDAFGQIFFSLSLGLGIITGYSRHADNSIDIGRSMALVVLGDFLVSCIAGFAVFGCIGYISHIQEVPFNTIVTSSSPFEMGFVIFPMILKTFGPLMYPIMGVLFFFCIFIAGITGVFSIIESCAGNIEVEFGYKRKKAVTIATVIMSSFAALFCMGNGQYIIGALDPMVCGFNMLVSGIAEIVCFMWISDKIKNNKVWVNAAHKRSFMFYSIYYFVPLCLLIVLVAASMHEWTTVLSYAKIVRWSWFTLAAAVAYGLSKNKK